MRSNTVFHLMASRTKWICKKSIRKTYFRYENSTDQRWHGWSKWSSERPQVRKILDCSISSPNWQTAPFFFAEFCRRQESMYTMTGLYSETADDSSIDVPADSENSEFSCPLPMNDAAAPSNYVADTVIKCHSRQPSTGIIDQREKDHDSDLDMSSVDCGILNCRPKSFQKFARIKVCRNREKCWICLGWGGTNVFSFVFDFFRRFSCYYYRCWWHCNRRSVLVTLIRW